MWTFNCARIYVGEYDNHDTNQYYDIITCGYKILDGNITLKELKPIRIKGWTGDGFKKNWYLDTFVIYPKTNEATIEISARKGSHQIHLIKFNGIGKSTIYKMRL